MIEQRTETQTFGPEASEEFFAEMAEHLFDCALGFKPEQPAFTATGTAGMDGGGVSSYFLCGINLNHAPPAVHAALAELRLALEQWD